MPLGRMVNWGCATFMPNDDKFVYILTGNDATYPTFDIYRYDFDLDSYALIMKNSSVTNLEAASCVGYTDSMNHNNLISIGGTTGSTDTVNKYQVRVLNLTSNIWSYLPDIPVESMSAKLFVDGNYLYAIGGQFDQSKYSFKMEITGAEGWILVHNITADTDTFRMKNFVIPYNLQEP